MENVSIKTAPLKALGERVKGWQAVTIAVFENHQLRIVNTIASEDLLCTEQYIADCSNLTGVAKIILSASSKITEAKFVDSMVEFAVGGKRIIFSRAEDGVEIRRLRLKKNGIEFDGASYDRVAKSDGSGEVYVLNLKNTYIPQKDKVRLFKMRKMQALRRCVSILERVSLYYEIENGAIKDIGLWSLKDDNAATATVKVVPQILLT